MNIKTLNKFKKRLVLTQIEAEIKIQKYPTIGC